MSVVMVQGGEIRAGKPSLMDVFRQWKQSYDDWLAGEGKSIEEGKKLQESKTGVEQFTRMTLGEKAGDVVRDLTDPEAVLKQVTRVAVILIVALVGIMALLQIMPVRGR